MRLLTGFEFISGDQRRELSMGPKRVLAFLALQAKPVARVYVAGALWPDTTEAHAQASLRSAVWKLSRVGSVVNATRYDLSLMPHVEVDVDEQIVAAVQVLDKNATAALKFDLHVLEGELLPDWYDDWVITERERLRQLRLHALDALVEKLTNERRYADAVEAAMIALRGDPFRESTHRALIRVHLAEGNVSEAVREYDMYRARLRRELGVEPSPDLRHLVQSACQIDE